GGHHVDSSHGSVLLWPGIAPATASVTHYRCGVCAIAILPYTARSRPCHAPLRSAAALARMDGAALRTCGNHGTMCIVTILSAVAHRLSALPAQECGRAASSKEREADGRYTRALRARHDL